MCSSGLKYVQSETTEIRLGFSRGEVAEMEAKIHRTWRESVETEVNRRLAERGHATEVQQANGSKRQISADRDVDSLLLSSEVNG
jgi:hypothetical protein